jgi:hypothetical protein
LAIPNVFRQGKDRHGVSYDVVVENRHLRQVFWGELIVKQTICDPEKRLRVIILHGPICLLLSAGFLSGQDGA